MTIRESLSIVLAMSLLSLGLGIFVKQNAPESGVHAMLAYDDMIQKEQYNETLRMCKGYDIKISLGHGYNGYYCFIPKKRK